MEEHGPIVRGAAGLLHGWNRLKIFVWGVFLLGSPPLLLWRGLAGFAIFLSALGLFYDLFLLERSRLRSFALVEHTLALLLGAYLVARPPSGGWELLPGSEDFSNVVVLSAPGQLFVYHGGETGAEVELSEGGAPLEPLGFEGGMGWAMAFDAAREIVWVLPRYGRALYTFSLRERRWAAFPRPEGHTQSFAISNGRPLIIIGWRLYTDNGAGLAPREELGYLFSVAADGPRVLAVGRRWYESTDGGATFRDITPPGAETNHAEAAASGGWRYVYEGGFFTGGVFFAAAPGGDFIPRELPVADIRTLVPNPKDGSEIWLGSWGEGVFRSRDGGASWEDMGLERVQVRSLAVDFEGRRAYAASSNLMVSKGLFTRSF